METARILELQELVWSVRALRAVRVQMRGARVQMRDARAQRRDARAQMRDARVQMRDARVQMRDARVHITECIARLFLFNTRARDVREFTWSTWFIYGFPVLGSCTSVVVGLCVLISSSVKFAYTDR